MSETSAGLGLKPKVKKSMQLGRRFLCDIGRRRPDFTTRSGRGGGGVDSIIERDDKLRKLTQVILWTVEGVYVLWLFLLPYAPVRNSSLSFHSLISLHAYLNSIL